jgi:pimeloyl-ACP methyl ester carboxylesterase
VIEARPEQLTLSDGRQVDVWLAGAEDATPVLFHSGTPSSGLPNPILVAALAAAGLRFVSFSRPGYGTSTRLPGRSVADVAPDTAAVLDHIGAEEAYVLGWSGGGPHALATVALLPERVPAAAVIGCVAPYPADGLDGMAGRGEENIEEFGAALEGADALIKFKDEAWPIFRAISPGDVAEGLGDLVDEVDRGAISEELAQWMASSWHEGLRQSYWGWFDDDMAFARPWGFDIGAIRVPVHIWQGGHDRMVPFGHGEWLARHVGSACPHLLPEHGHLSLAFESLPEILRELTSR